MQSFDATNIPPQQGINIHPAGPFPFTISNTFGKLNKDGNGYHFVVEFQSDAGRIENRYNLWNASAQAVEIANKELSALCHAIGIFRLNFPTNQDGTPNLPMFGAEIRGGRGRMEVGPQANNPQYMEIKRVFDSQGNEPGRPGQGAFVQQTAPQPQQQPQGQPAVQSGWGAPPPPQQQASQAAPAPTQGGWNNNPAPQQQQQPTQSPPVVPPWATR